MTHNALHPIAQEVISASASSGFFCSKRLTVSLAERNPIQCLNWALTLIAQSIDESASPAVVVNTLAAVRTTLCSPSSDLLPMLNDLTSQCWTSGIFDDTRPFLQRAVARLGWAAMCLICETTNAQFTSDHIVSGKNATITQMAGQCAMAVDLTYTSTRDGQLMVSSSFSREMGAAS